MSYFEHVQQVHESWDFEFFRGFEHKNALRRNLQSICLNEVLYQYLLGESFNDQN